MIGRRRPNSRIIVCFLIAVLVLFVVTHLYYTCQRSSSIKSINQTDLFRYANATWPQRRIPRTIHQTYRTHIIPAVWNSSVQAVMTMNSDRFKYRRWSHLEMEDFVRQHETDFYWNTFIHYPYDIQRIDSFRYILLFHLGGIYIDMDDACHRPFQELITTMEALDPYSTHLALFPSAEIFGIQNNFMISTPHHPLFKQMITRLHLFHHNYLIFHVTILLSVGPLYATIQEHLFQQTNDQSVRRLDHQTYRLIFWKTKGGSWFHRDTLMILELYYNRHRILKYLFVSLLCVTSVFIAFITRRQKCKVFRILIRIVGMMFNRFMRIK